MNEYYVFYCVVQEEVVSWFVVNFDQNLLQYFDVGNKITDNQNQEWA